MHEPGASGTSGRRSGRESQRQRQSDRLSLLFVHFDLVFSPQRQPDQGIDDGSAFYERAGDMESTTSTRNARRVNVLRSVS